MKKIIIVSTFFFFAYCNVYAQQSDNKSSMWIGLFGGVNFNQHTADFQGLPGIPSCCPQYENGSGSGFAVGALIELPLFTDVSLAIRPNFSSYNAELTSKEFNPIRLADQTIGQAEFNHVLVSNFSALSVDGLLQYKVLNRLGLVGGVRVGILSSGTFTQSEKITSNNGTFKNGKTIQNEFTGDIPDRATLNAGFTLGLMYDLSLNSRQTLKLVPEALFSYGITPLVSNLSWNNHYFRVGVSLKYSPFETVKPVIVPEEKMQEKPTEPVLAEKPKIAPAEVAATIYTNDNKPATEQKLIVRELLSKQVVPMLPMIFFDQKSSQIPQRYIQITKNETDKFSEKQLRESEGLAAYYQTLNVIGSRMKNNAKFTIKIIGSNSDAGEEKGNISLSQARVNSVKKYLSEVWSINESRITSETRNLPAKFSNIESEEGRQENSRLEFVSSNPALLAPIIVFDTARAITYNRMDIELTGGLPAVVGRWGFNAKGKDNSKYVIYDNYGTPVTRQFSWDIDNSSVLEFLRTQNSIAVNAFVESESGDKVDVTTASIPVDYKVLELGKDSSVAVKTFNVIMFDVDKYELNEENKNYLQQLIPEVTATSRLTITGYTDRTGDAAYNQTLSLNRARSVAREIGSPNVIIKGVGESRPLYDNNLPEGRFYNRTVEVIIEE
ncbi:MAG: OmpA family protein [Candidatus Kapabacteria bacterium]|nr:OmpA family protein [Candidatus Kapabacteria bacterium]